jgi:hypothetical protein
MSCNEIANDMPKIMNFKTYGYDLPIKPYIPLTRYPKIEILASYNLTQAPKKRPQTNHISELAI